MSPIVTTASSSASRPKTRQPPISAALEWLRPTTTLPTGMTFDPGTGKITGTAYDTTEPTWATTNTSLSNTGNGATNASNLQSLLNSLATSATGNTVIHLPAGFFTTAQVTLPVNTSGYWIGLRTASHASLPTPTAGSYNGTTVPNKTSRVGPSSTGVMFEMRVAGGNAPALVTASGASKYYIRGAYFSNPSNYTTYCMVLVTGASDIVFSQCYCNADCTTTAKANTQRVYYCTASNKIGVVDNYCEYVGYSGVDSQFVLALDGGSSWRIVNNYSAICSSSYHFISGGGYPTLPGNDPTRIPRDGEIRWNTFDYPAAYETITPGLAKNVVEFKMGQRWLIEGNDVLRYPGLGGQAYAFATKVTNQNASGGTNVRTEHICFRFNRARNYRCGFSMTGIELGPDLTVQPDYIEASHNLFYDRFAAGWNFAQLGGMTNWRFANNTAISGGDGVYFFYGTGRGDMINNVIAWASGEGNNLAVYADSITNSDAVKANCLAAGSRIDTNLFTRGASSGYTGNFLVGANPSSVPFTDYAARDLTLGATSVGKGAGTNGYDIGIYMPLLNDLIAGII